MTNATIYDIAKMADCSPATVSLALNHSNRVKASTKQKILEIAKKLNYTPNVIAQSLITKVSHTIGVIIPNIENPIYSCMVSGIEEYACSKEYSLIVCISSSDIEKEKADLDVLIKKRIDGIIFLPSHLDRIKESVENALTTTPIVLCGSSGKDIDGLNYAKCDNRLGAYLATNHLIDNKYDKIGCIFPVTDKQQSQSRLKGYRDALKERNIPYDESMIKYCSVDNSDIYNATLELLDKKHPRAIFCLYDYCAIVVSSAILSKGLRIPEDIAIIGYDNISISKFCPMPLSTIDTHSKQIGRLSTEMLINKIVAPESQVDSIILEPTLVVRDSTKQTN